jgi:ribosomal protein S18 acetylase RimI-like enzyme
LAELIHLADLAHYSTSGYEVSIGGSREHQVGEIAKLVRAEARSQFHFSHFDVAVMEDGTIASAVAGFDRSETDLQMVPALQQIGWDKQAIEELAKRIGPLGASVPEEIPGTWTIEHVATLPGFRGQGLARRLLDRVLERGAGRGYLNASVDVFLGNSKARAIYEAAGFRKTGEFGHGPMREILGRDGVERMMKLLVAVTIKDPAR